MASASDNTPAPSRRQFFSSAAGAGLAAAGPPIFTVAGTTAMVEACNYAINHTAWMDQRVSIERWSDARFALEAGKAEAVFIRAINEPSKGLPDLLAKARLSLSDRDRFCSDTDELDNGERLSLVVVREVVALLGGMS